MAFFHHAGAVSSLAASDLDIGSILSINADLNRVGVGTASPAVTLDVIGTISSALAESSLSQGVVQVGVDSGGDPGGELLFHTDDYVGIRCANSGDVSLAVKPSGKVGVGTTAPAQVLDVIGIGSFALAETSLSQGIVQVGVDSGGDPGGELMFHTDDYVGIRCANSGTPPFVVKPSGNVGIGNNAPAQALHIGDDSTTTATVVRLETDDSFVDMGIAQSSADMLTTANAQAFVINNNGNNGDILFGTNDTQRMMIDVSGNVGIGLASMADPPGTLLQLENTAPYVTLKNSTAENSDGGCESKLIFEDHGNNALGQIEVSHVGSDDDEKGQLILSTNNDSGLQAALTISEAQLATFGGSIVIPDDGTIGSASDADAVKITAVGNLAHRGAVTLSTSTSSIDLTSTTHSTQFILDAVMADAQRITLPQPTAALAGMVIDVHLMQDCATDTSSGTAIGLANGGSATLKGSLTLSSAGAATDAVAIPSAQKAIWLDSDAANMGGGAAGSHYQFIYAGGTSTVYVKAQAMTTGTPALAAANAFGGGYGT